MFKFNLYLFFGALYVCASGSCLSLYVDPDPYPTYQFDADPDPQHCIETCVFAGGGIYIICLYAHPDPACHFDADPDPYPTYQFDADPDPYPTYQFDADPDPQLCLETRVCVFMWGGGGVVYHLPCTRI